MHNAGFLFLRESDVLAEEINRNANALYVRLLQLDVSHLPIAAQYKDYFKHHHLGARLVFSLQNSAHIIYDSVRLCGKAIKEITFIDYGAGLGTLYMLAGTMNFKNVVYNDYLPEWQQTAQSICEAMQIQLAHYVTGDIDAVMEHAATHQLRYDIVASRNVVEHIYNLPQFYSSVHRNNPAAVVYSTTTANFHNPAMRWYHWYIHTSNERKYYRPSRKLAIQKLQPSLSNEALEQLTDLTRGKGQADFTNTIAAYLQQQPITKDPTLRSNTCDYTTGVWCEHLLTKREHTTIIEAAGFRCSFTAGYWDTHYSSSVKNMAAGLFNRLIRLLGKENGILLSPFVNIIAYPTSKPSL